MGNTGNKPKRPSPEEQKALFPKEVENLKAREHQIDRKDSPTPITIGLEDIDSAIMYYFNEVIKPSVVTNGQKISVPIMYGSPERWSNVQKDGALRDKTGKFIAPLIMFKRDTITKNRNLTTKIDSNNPHNFVTIENRYTKANVYDKFSALNNRVPKREYVSTVVPDFVTINYSCNVFTDYVDHLNKIVESINYAEGTYWGDRSKFLFRSKIDSFNTVVEVSSGTDRIATSTFTIVLDGYMIPKTEQTDKVGQKKFYSKSQVNFNLETVSSFEDL